MEAFIISGTNIYCIGNSFVPNAVLAACYFYVDTSDQFGSLRKASFIQVNIYNCCRNGCRFFKDNKETFRNC